MKLDHIKQLTGTITVVTGLHIGAGRESMEIGGMDNPVMRDPVSDKPYIPGSSIKGKMRSIMEISTGKIGRDGAVQTNPKIAPDICRIFGTTEEADFGPTRLIVRDACLNREKTAKALDLPDDFVPEDIIEIKYENTINRITGTAKHPRPIERVVPGCVFDLEILFKVFVLDNETSDNCEDLRLFEKVRELLKVLEHDALGGSGSRGSGKVKVSLNDPVDIRVSELLSQGA
ncbi:MAG: type III-A CRISPR-associated RAMP protein Csm3 [Candidatus Sumerlaeaceae bacterium]|nr:type III-A CRISPR-associated RAMP protein Csm3 [Candidatus Sumerlaeaceae bacterium]